MIFVYIENKETLTKIINYLNIGKINYTTNKEDQYNTILISEINKRTEQLLEENKKVYFILYDLEKIIYQKMDNVKFKNKIYNFLNKVDKIIVSLPIYQEILKNVDSKVVVIPKPLPPINISKNYKDIYIKYSISKRKKKILVIDLDYNNLESVISLGNTYNKYNILYVGYKPKYKMTKKEIKKYLELPKNISYIVNYDKQVISDILKISTMVINYEDINLDIEYIYLILLFKKELLTKESLLIEDYLINSKNVYTFKTTEELLTKLNKIENDRFGDLTSKGYELVEKNDISEIIKKIKVNLES